MLTQLLEEEKKLGAGTEDGGKTNEKEIEDINSDYSV